jgi:uncharacterized phiE125 gp8 family phage protein
MGLKLITAPTDEPLSLAQAKAHLRVDGTAEDDLIHALIEAARARAEDETHRALITQTWEYTRDWLEEPGTTPTSPTALSLPLPPLQQVTQFAYYDSTNALAYLHDEVGSPTVTGNLIVDTHSSPARIAPLAGAVWPATGSQINAVTVRFVAGYGNNGDAVPTPIKQAMLLMLGLWFESREAAVIGTISSELPLGAKWLLEPYRVMVFA